MSERASEPVGTVSHPVGILDVTQDGFFGPLQVIPEGDFQWGRDVESEVEQLRAVLDREGAAGSVADLGGGRHLELLGAAGILTAGAADPLAASFDRSFDAAILLSGWLGRQVTNRRILDAFAALSSLLRPGGLVLFDFLDGEAVLRARLPRRGLTETGEPASPLLCGHTSDVRLDEQILRLTIRTWRLAGDRVVDRTPERTHDVRYFLPRELRLLLSVAGFEPLGTAPLAGQREPAWLRLAWARKS